MPLLRRSKKSSFDDEFSNLPILDLLQLRQQPKSKNLQQALKLFRGLNSEAIRKEMTAFVSAKLIKVQIHTD